jgi:ectoine hydroxylase-related dioxygenase (phytanoyl-CoA dioxygenase family)
MSRNSARETGAAMTAPFAVAGQQRQQFERDGYFVLPGAMPAHHLDAMRAACDAFVAEYDSTETQVAASDAEAHGGVVRYRMTPDGKRVRDNIITQKHDRYFLQGRYVESPAMRNWLFSDVIASICAATIGPDAFLYNEQFVVKHPGGKGDLAWHQDSGYVPYAHRPYVTIWCALDAATVENGTIYVLPYARAGTRERVEHVRIPGRNDAVGYSGDDPGDPVEVPAGSIVVFSSTLFHRSGPNRASAPRRAHIGQYTATPFMTDDGSRIRFFADPLLRAGQHVAAA